MRITHYYRMHHTWPCPERAAFAEPEPLPLSTALRLVNRWNGAYNSGFTYWADLDRSGD